MTDRTSELSPAVRKFILHWGELGTRWGINRTVAQIHALLYISDAPLPADRIGPHGSDAVRVGVRPEKITLVPAGQECPSGSNVLRGTIVVAAFLGVSIQYLIRAAGGEELTVFAQNAEGSEPESLGVGQEVQLAWQPQHTFVVAKENTNAG